MSDPTASRSSRRPGVRAALLLLVLFAGWQVANVVSRPDPVEVMKQGVAQFGVDPAGLSVERVRYGSNLLSYSVEGRFFAPGERFVEIHMERSAPFLGWSVQSFRQGARE